MGRNCAHVLARNVSSTYIFSPLYKTAIYTHPFGVSRWRLKGRETAFISCAVGVTLILRFRRYRSTKGKEGNHHEKVSY